MRISDFEEAYCKMSTHELELRVKHISVFGHPYATTIDNGVIIKLVDPYQEWLDKLNEELKRRHKN